MRKFLLGSATLASVIAVGALPEAALGQTAPPPNNCNNTTGTPVPPDIATCGPVLAILQPPAGRDPSFMSALGMSDDGRIVLAAFFESGSGVTLLRIRDGVPNVVATDAEIPFGQITTGVSGDGSTLVGYALSPNNAVYQATYWSAANGYRFIPLPPNYTPGGYSSEARAVNSDGSLILVNGGGTGAGGGTVYTWSPVSGFQTILSPGLVPGTPYRAEFYVGAAMSSDGGVIAGRFIDCPTSCSGPSGSAQVAFSWTSSTGVIALPFLSNSSYFSGLYSRFSDVNGISNDGSTIVGSSVAADGTLQAVYWRNSQITGLGYIPSTDSRQFQTIATAANANGSTIVGGTTDSSGTFPDNQAGLAWRWTATSGMQSLNSLASGLGLSLDGWSMTEAIDISANGNAILGNAYNGTRSQLRPFLLSIASLGVTTTTQSRLLVEVRLPDVTQQAIVNQTFRTRLRGTLNGVNISDSSFVGALGDPAGMSALVSARNAIQQAAGLRRISIGAPALIGVTTANSNPREATLDELVSVQTTLASVTTTGPGSVATGDRGTCAMPAATNVNPTGCSLPGTTVTLNAGDTNINNYTNTINTRQRTTTVTVDQVQTSEYAIAGIAGNQFGTVHALVGPAAFERGDRLIGQLLDMGDGDEAVSIGMARAVMPVRDESGFGGGESGLTMFGSYFGGRTSIGADASIPVARVKGDSNGFVLGLQQALGDSAHIGIAVDHGSSDYTVRDPRYPETLKLKHTQAALFAGWSDGGFSLSGAASYGFGTARTNMLTSTTPAIGKRDINSWSLGAQVGYALPLGKDASLTPHIGIRHTSAKLKGFTEVGGPTPLLGLSQTVDRTRLYAGLEAKAGIDLGGLTLTPRVYGRIARDSGDASGTADLVFASAPAGPAMQALGPGVGKTVAELGGSLDTEVSGDVHLWAGYDGSFRDQAKSHTAKVGLTINW